MSCYHGSRNDSHNLLRVIQAMSDTEQGGRNQLKLFKPDFRRMRTSFPAQVKNYECKSESHNHADEGSQKDECRNLQDDVKLYRFKAVSHYGSTCKSSD